MKVTAAMIRPMASVTINSNNVNPRFPLDFIIPFEGEQQPFEGTGPLVSHASAVENRPPSADNRTGLRSFIASVHHPRKRSGKRQSTEVQRTRSVGPLSGQLVTLVRWRTREFKGTGLSATHAGPARHIARRARGTAKEIQVGRLLQET